MQIIDRFSVPRRRGAEAPATIELLQGDLSARGAGTELARRAADGMGGIDILVLNAAEQRRAPMTEVTAEDFEIGRASCRERV